MRNYETKTFLQLTAARQPESCPNSAGDWIAVSANPLVGCRGH